MIEGTGKELVVEVDDYFTEWQVEVYLDAVA